MHLKIFLRNIMKFSSKQILDFYNDIQILQDEKKNCNLIMVLFDIEIFIKIFQIEQQCFSLIT